MKAIERDTLQAIEALGRPSTVADICEASGWSRSGVAIALDVLRAGGHVDRAGGGAKGLAGLWGRPDAVAELRATHAGPYLYLTAEQREAAVLRALEAAPGSAEDIARRCGWPSRAGVLVTRGILSVLVRASRARLTLGRPWTWSVACSDADPCARCSS